MTVLTYYFIMTAIIVIAIIYNIIFTIKLCKQCHEVINKKLSIIGRNIDRICIYHEDINAAIVTNTKTIKSNNEVIHEHIRHINEVVAQHKRNKAKNSSCIRDTKKAQPKINNDDKQLKTAKIREKSTKVK